MDEKYDLVGSPTFSAWQKLFHAVKEPDTSSEVPPQIATATTAAPLPAAAPSITAALLTNAASKAIALPSTNAASLTSTQRAVIRCRSVSV